MHPLILLLLHLAALGGALIVLLFGLMFTTGTSVQSGERAVAIFLCVAALGGIAATVSLHWRLPASLGLAAKLGLDLLCLVAATAMLAALGLVAVLVFNR
jgi:hypothetical protein